MYLYGENFFINLDTTPIYVNKTEDFCFATADKNEFIISYHGESLFQKLIQKIKAEPKITMIDIRDL